MMNDLLKKAVSLGVGLTMASKDKIEKVVDDLVRTGDVGQSESRELVTRLVQRGEEQQAELKRFVKEQLHSLLAELRVATKEDVERLERRLSALEGTAAAEAEAEPPRTTAP